MSRVNLPKFVSLLLNETNAISPSPPLLDSILSVVFIKDLSIQSVDTEDLYHLMDTLNFHQDVIRRIVVLLDSIPNTCLVSDFF